MPAAEGASEMTSAFDIGVVGAGFSGLALLAALRRHGFPGRLALIGTPSEFGCGYAYSTAAGNFLLNSRADRTGLHAGLPGGFADWLGLEGPARSGFASRADFGAYLQAELQRLRADLGQRLVCIPARVVAAERGRRWRLTLADGGRVDCRKLVLACGPLPSVAPNGTDRAALEHPRYIRDPLRPGVLDRLSRRGRVLLVGTGLTMVDSALALLDRGHSGPLLAVSRHGLLPLPHTQGVGSPCERVLPQGRRISSLAAFRLLRRAVAAGDDWRALMDGLRDELPEWWRSCTATERGRFLRHLAPVWSVHRHRLPHRHWERLQEAMESGQLEVRAAHILRLAPGPRALRATLRWRGQAASHRVACTAVLQATGFSGQIGSSGNPLLASLHQAGWLRRDPLGLGLDSTRGGGVRSAGGRASPGLYALGALTRGEAWDISAVPELRRAADELAQRLVGAQRNAPRPTPTQTSIERHHEPDH